MPLSVGILPRYIPWGTLLLVFVILEESGSFYSCPLIFSIFLFIATEFFGGILLLFYVVLVYRLIMPFLSSSFPGIFEHMTQAELIIVPHLPGQFFPRVHISVKSGPSEFFLITLQLGRNHFLSLSKP